MGTVQLLTDQMIASAGNTQEPTSEDVLHEEAVHESVPDAPNPLINNKPSPLIGNGQSPLYMARKPRRKKEKTTRVITETAPDIYSESQTIGQKKEAERTAKGNWSLYQEPKKKKKTRKTKGSWNPQGTSIGQALYQAGQTSPSGGGAQQVFTSTPPPSPMISPPQPCP